MWTLLSFNNHAVTSWVCTPLWTHHESPTSNYHVSKPNVKMLRRLKRAAFSGTCKFTRKTHFTHHAPRQNAGLCCKSPQPEEEWNQSGKSELTKGAAKSCKCSGNHTPTTVVSDFRVEVCLDGAKKKRKKKEMLTMRTNPSFCLFHRSPPPSDSLRASGLSGLRRLFLLGRSL